MNPSKPARSLVLLAAVDRNGVLGRRGPHPLPWHLPADLRRFKARTLGCPVLMGRHTAESIGRALPGRLNLILTRTGQAPFPKQVAVATLAEALAHCEGQDLKVIGGSEVYALALPFATGIELTRVDATLDLDVADAVRFPELDATWRVAAREGHPRDEENAHAMVFMDYVRRTENMPS